MSSSTTSQHAELQFLRAFRSLLDKMISKSETESLSRGDVSMAYEVVMSAMRRSNKNRLPELSIPLVSELPSGQLFLNKPTNLVFKKLDNEYVAYGTWLDGSQVVKLTIQDAVIAVANGWRFFEDRCVTGSNLILNSQYSVVPAE
jgi:hypothetical protein